MQSPNKVYNDQNIYFVTSTIVEKVPIFISKVYFDILIDSLNYCSKNKHFQIYAWIIMPNFFHLICQAPDLSRTMQSLKRHSAREILYQLEHDNQRWILNLLAYYKKQHKTQSDYQVWQEGFHPERILDDDKLMQKIEYMHFFPVKAGFVKQPNFWQNSSAAYYADSGESRVFISPLTGQAKLSFTR